MSQIIILNFHSIVDVITNSSSELFVCDTDKDLEFIKESLQELLTLYNKISGNNYNFDDVFGAIEKCDTAANISLVREYLKDYGSNGIKVNNDSIFILSASDNTIPYWLQELIEDIFNANRIHLG